MFGEYIFHAQAGTSVFNDGVRFATLALSVQAVGFVAIGFCVDTLAKAVCGHFSALVALHIATWVCLVLIRTGNQWCAGAGIVLVAAPYQVISNSPIAWVEQNVVSSIGDRGRIIGILSTTVSWAQIGVAIVSGPLVQLLGDRIIVEFDASACIAAAVSVPCACAVAMGYK